MLPLPSELCGEKALPYPRRSELTFRPLLLDSSLQHEIQGFAAHLSGEHEEDLYFARGPY